MPATLSCQKMCCSYCDDHLSAAECQAGSKRVRGMPNRANAKRADPTGSARRFFML